MFIEIVVAVLGLWTVPNSEDPIPHDGTGYELSVNRIGGDRPSNFFLELRPSPSALRVDGERRIGAFLFTGTGSPPEQVDWNQYVGFWPADEPRFQTAAGLGIGEERRWFRLAHVYVAIDSSQVTVRHDIATGTGAQGAYHVSRIATLAPDDVMRALDKWTTAQVTVTSEITFIQPGPGARLRIKLNREPTWIPTLAVLYGNDTQYSTSEEDQLHRESLDGDGPWAFPATSADANANDDYFLTLVVYASAGGYLFEETFKSKVHSAGGTIEFEAPALRPVGSSLEPLSIAQATITNRSGENLDVEVSFGGQKLPKTFTVLGVEAWSQQSKAAPDPANVTSRRFTDKKWNDKFAFKDVAKDPPPSYWLLVEVHFVDNTGIAQRAWLRASFDNLAVGQKSPLRLVILSEASAGKRRD